jgi:hypothetical protein
MPRPGSLRGSVMGQLNPAEWPLNLRRSMPFVTAMVLGLLAWQLPVVAELGGDEEFPALAVQLQPTVSVPTALPPAPAPTTSLPTSPPVEIPSPPNTRRTTAATFSTDHDHDSPGDNNDVTRWADNNGPGSPDHRPVAGHEVDVGPERVRAHDIGEADP